MGYRDLRKTEEKIKNFQFLATIGLCRGDSSQCTYWIDIYVHNVRGINVYMWSMQYSFVRSSIKIGENLELVEGHKVVPSRYTQIHNIIEDVKRRLTQKITGGWQIYNHVVFKENDADNVSGLIDKMVSNASKSVKRAPSTSKESFSDAQEDRKKKALW